MHDMMPQDNPATTPNAGHDREGAMAKADLFKLANYSLKLFKQIQDEDQLEAWVQAKITKAADYVASVYHYLEYEMKFSEYGEKLNDAEMYSEEQKQVIRNKLMEAKEKMKELKKAQAEKQDTKAVKEAEDRPASKKKETTWTDKSGKKHPATRVQGSKSVAADKEADKERKKHDKELDESEDRKPAKKSEREVELPSGAKVKATKVQGWQSQKADKEADKEKKKHDKELDEGAKPDFLDMDKDGNKKEPMKKAVADKKKNPFAKNDKKVKEAVADKGDMDKDGKDEPDSKEYMDNKDAAIKKATGKEKKVKETFLPAKVASSSGPIGKILGKKKGMSQADAGTGEPKPKIEPFKGQSGAKHGGDWNQPEPSSVQESIPQNPDGATAPPKKDPKTGRYPKVTSGPNKGKEWSPNTPGPTNPAMKESLAESAEVLRIKELTQRLLG